MNVIMEIINGCACRSYERFTRASGQVVARCNRCGKVLWEFSAEIIDQTERNEATYSELRKLALKSRGIQ